MNQHCSFVTMIDDQVHNATLSLTQWVWPETGKTCPTCGRTDARTKINVKLEDNYKCWVNLAFNFGSTIVPTANPAIQTDNYVLELLLRLWLKNLAANAKFYRNLQVCDASPRCKLRILGQLSSLDNNSVFFLIACTQALQSWNFQ